MKNVLNNLLRFGLSGALLWWLYTKIDVAQTVEVVKSADLGYILIAFLFFTAINAILIFRWIIFIKALGLRAPLPTAIRYYLIGLFGNLFLPSAIGGDVIKILGLCQNSDQKPKVVASVLLDRLSGFAGIVLVATVSAVVGFRLIEGLSIFWAIGLMAAGSVVVATILFNEKVYSFCCRIFDKFPKLKDGLMRMRQDIGLVQDKPFSVVQAVVLSAISQLTLAVTFYFVAKALHQDIALFYFIIFIPLICVFATIPSIGGLGVREAGAAYFLGKVGVASGVAVSISLVNFLFMVLIGLLGGLYYVVTPKSAVDTKV